MKKQTKKKDRKAQEFRRQAAQRKLKRLLRDRRNYLAIDIQDRQVRADSYVASLKDSGEKEVAKAQLEIDKEVEAWFALVEQKYEHPSIVVAFCYEHIKKQDAAVMGYKKSLETVRYRYDSMLLHMINLVLNDNPDSKVRAAEDLLRADDALELISALEEEISKLQSLRIAYVDRLRSYQLKHQAALRQRAEEATSDAQIANAISQKWAGVAHPADEAAMQEAQQDLHQLQTLLSKWENCLPPQPSSAAGFTHPTVDSQSTQSIREALQEVESEPAPTPATETEAATEEQPTKQQRMDLAYIRDGKFVSDFPTPPTVPGVALFNKRKRYKNERIAKGGKTLSASMTTYANLFESTFVHIVQKYVKARMMDLVSNAFLDSSVSFVLKDLFRHQDNAPNAAAIEQLAVNAAKAEGREYYAVPVWDIKLAAQYCAVYREDDWAMVQLASNYVIEQISQALHDPDRKVMQPVSPIKAAGGPVPRATVTSWRVPAQLLGKIKHPSFLPEIAQK